MNRGAHGDSSLMLSTSVLSNENRQLANVREEAPTSSGGGGCHLVHDDPEISQNDFDILMRLEEEYPDLLYTGKSLFLPPDNESDITPGVMDLLNRDPETLIFDILKYYKNGAKGKPIVPKELLEASPYNQGLLEILKQIYDQRVK